MRLRYFVSGVMGVAVLLCSLAHAQDMGNLRVTITPEEVVSQGALWRRADTEIWYRSGETEMGIPKGTYTVEFFQLPG